MLAASGQTPTDQAGSTEDTRSEQSQGGRLGNRWRRRGVVGLVGDAAVDGEGSGAELKGDGAHRGVGANAVESEDECASAIDLGISASDGRIRICE